MRKDLTVLARNHAVTDVIIVSAEEDLALAVADVQEYGVRTVLLHIAVDGSGHGARALRQECDDVIEVSASHLRPFAELIVGAEPQFSGSGYRDQPAGSGVPQSVAGAAGPRLYASPVPAGYEQAAALTSPGGQREDRRDLAASGDTAGFPAARHGDNGHAGSVQRGPDVRPAQVAQPAPHYQQTADPLAAGLPAETGFGPGQFGGPSGASATNGHGGSAQHGLPHPPAHPSAGAPGTMGNGLAQPGLPGPAVGGMPDPGGPAAGVPGYGLEAAGGPPSGVARPGLPNGSGLASNGPSQHGPAGGQFGAGPAGLGQQQGFPAAGQAMPGAQLGAPSQLGLGQQQVPPAPAQHGLGQPGIGQPGIGQPGIGQQGQTPAQPGAHRQLSGGLGGPQGQNALVPIEPPRSSLPARQLPAGGGMPYAQDPRMPYADQLQQPQFGAPNGQQPYPPAGYGGQPAQLPGSSLSVGDAVQSAHAEGFGFGEAVARDAPALWLEAVLARKPRMPSDLEARLLQGSALPIDSLLHDEVRHALRRGFWDALERSRH
jgi:hypothetical protein